MSPGERYSPWRVSEALSAKFGVRKKATRWMSFGSQERMAAARVVEHAEKGKSKFTLWVCLAPTVFRPSGLSKAIHLASLHLRT